MSVPSVLLLGLLLAAQSPEPAAPREAFHVACGERICRVQNIYAEFEVTRGDVRVERILGHAQGERVRMRVTGAEGGRPETVSIMIGRAAGQLVGGLSRAARIEVIDCRPREGDRSPSPDPCLINLDDLDVAVENARMRLTVARRRW